LNPIQVGFLLYRVENGLDGRPQVARWRASDLFVPHALIGAGIIARLLDAVIDYFVSRGFKQLKVELVTSPRSAGSTLPEQGRDRGNRQALTHAINFYKSRDFVYEMPESKDSPEHLVRLLGDATDDARPSMQ